MGTCVTISVMEGRGASQRWNVMNLGTQGCPEKILAVSAAHIYCCKVKVQIAVLLFN
jgi:hypothetical protein